MTLPVLELSGTAYSLKRLDEGLPAALVVEKPENYKGKRFRFAEGEGFREVELGEAVGPFRSLMTIPPFALHGLDCMRLRELGAQ